MGNRSNSDENSCQQDFVDALPYLNLDESFNDLVTKRMVRKLVL